MKRINIFMSRLKYGGMELSLINFINQTSISETYDVHLYLIYSCNNELIDKIDKKVKIHLICKKRWNIINKFITAIKLVYMCIKPPKSSIAICYSNHQKILSYITRKSSKKNILFVHSDLNRYETEDEKNKIKNKIKFNLFSKIVCVSEVVKKSLVNIYGDSIAKKCYVINNYVDGDKIQNLSKEKIKENIDFKIPTFINIANHVEKYKNIKLIIETAKELKKEKYNFQILLIGSGEDTNSYIELINKYKLNKYIIILGSKSNPYPYLKNSKALLFTSKYEGYGMVLDEARVLETPIITTGSGASVEICNEGYGKITNNLKQDLINIIKEKDYKTKNFDYLKHNKNITNKCKNILDNC